MANPDFGPQRGYPDDADNIQGFLKLNPTYMVPYVTLGACLHGLQYVPKAQAYFAAHSMEPWGLQNAAIYAAYAIVMAYAVHGFIAVFHDQLVEVGLKLQETKGYHFNQQKAATRYTVVMFCQVCVYWALPIRACTGVVDSLNLPLREVLVPVLEFFIGLSILNIYSDAWFFFCHKTCHSPGMYEFFHKTHHRWRCPTPFGAYYISKWGNLVQEHMCTVPAMLFFPVPLSSWMYFQYVGTFGSLLQHANFLLAYVKPIPFVPVSLGQILTIFNPWGLILGSHTAAHHDYHHENFIGNFQLSYTYLDRLFGTYVEPNKVVPVPTTLNEPLAPQAPVSDMKKKLDEAQAQLAIASKKIEDLEDASTCAPQSPYIFDEP
jgi:sterol desaturase/sphingolipid hydroxylase (fatty acid hydroxylase superfamily)